MSVSNSDCIEVTSLNFAYNDYYVLKDINLSVKRGEYLGIIGPNGGGKTTLLKIILGLLKADSGEIRILGSNLRDFSEWSRIGYVPQRVAQADFYFPATVEEVVRSGRTAKVGLFKGFSQEDNAAVEKAMSIAGIADYRGRLIGNLSGGERQRVYIARALACEPSILLLDEPAVGVDIASQEKFYSFLGHLNGELGITVVFVSHDVGVVAQEVSTLVCLNHQMICHGSPENFIKEEFLEQVYGRKVTSVMHGH